MDLIDGFRKVAGAAVAWDSLATTVMKARIILAPRLRVLAIAIECCGECIECTVRIVDRIFFSFVLSGL